MVSAACVSDRRRIAFVVAVAIGIFVGAAPSAGFTAAADDSSTQPLAPPPTLPAPAAQPAPADGAVRSAPWSDLPKEGKAAVEAAGICCDSGNCPSGDSPISLQLNLDLASAHFFRGIRQEDRGVVVQPAAKVTLRLWEDCDSRIDAFGSLWNSFHTRTTNAEDRGGEFIGHWYELDAAAGVTYTTGPFAFSAGFTVRTSPSNAFSTVHELNFKAAFDDSEWLGDWAMHPYAALAWEIGSNASDGADSDTGVYFEIGVEPRLAFCLDGCSCCGYAADCCRGTPITVSFPVTVGLSLSEYYQDAAGDDSTLGYVQVGTKVSVPLPIACGEWRFIAGIYALFLGNNTRNFNGGRRTEIIGSVGVQANF